MSKMIDMTGWKMWEHGIPDSRIIVISRTNDYISPKGQHKTQWICECVCDKHTTLTATSEDIRNGTVKSCGCLKYEKSKARGKTHEEYVAQVAEKHPNIEVVGHYVNARTPIEHRCLEESCGHIWLSTPDNILSGAGCNQCAIKRRADSRRHTHDQYIARVAQINNNIEVVGEYINSNTKITHRCKIDGYEWDIEPFHIISGTGCPLCGESILLEGYNDLATTHPYLVEEWDYDANGDLLPTMVTRNSVVKVGWKCVHGHTYEAYINNKARRGDGCPVCNKENKVSFKELVVYYYIHKYFNDAISSYSDRENNLTELDVFIPSLCIGIEYDGAFYHQNIDRDKNKDDICKKLNIELIRIREPGCPTYQSTCNFITLKDSSINSLNCEIVNILKQLNINVIDIDFISDLNKVYSLIDYNKKENSLFEKFPSIALEWDYSKNGNLTPETVNSGSSKLVWWKCLQCGHEWKTTINSRTNSGCGCRICGAKKVAESSSKKVYCLELNSIFKSLANANLETGIAKSGICKNLKNKQSFAGKHPITKEKLHWYYVYDQIENDGTILPGAITFGFINNNIDKNEIL